MKRMLINATQPEELRVALVDGQKLYNLDVEVPSREQKKANIYKGKITRIEPSLEAAFVDYGSERHGFLPFKEISSLYLAKEAFDERGRPSVKDGIKEGQELIIQVEKEERGSKGAALTTKAGLAGRYLVLMPTDSRAGGVSRRIEGEDRDTVREALANLNIPKGMGVIVRTAGVGRSLEELQWDLDYLINVWSAIQKAATEREAPFLIYQESNVIIRALRDHYSQDIGEIVIDEEAVYQQAHNFLQQIMPQEVRKLRRYDDPIPLFNRFQIESQIESAYQREVSLPSGGAVVIDHTEALTAIDINSAKATKGSDIEETALHTNLEAADEIARQLRLRDLGGLVVIDFIDMASIKNQREVENRLRQALKLDRARVRVGRISRFGLLEMSRQRLRPSLGESSQITCPRCTGHGSIRSIESLALVVLRLVEEEAIKENSKRVVAQIPVDVATFLINEKREAISEIEARNVVDITLVPNPNLETPNYLVERLRLSDMDELKDKSSYEMATYQTEAFIPDQKTPSRAPEKPAVRGVAPNAPAPKSKKPGLLRRLLKALFGSSKKAKKPRRSSRKPQNKHRRGKRTDADRNRGRNTRGQNRRRQTQDRSNRKPNEESESATTKKAKGKKTSSRDGSTTRGGRRGGRQNTGDNRTARGGGRRRAPGKTRENADEQSGADSQRRQRNVKPRDDSKSASAKSAQSKSRNTKNTQQNVSDAKGNQTVKDDAVTRGNLAAQKTEHANMPKDTQAKPSSQPAEIKSTESTAVVSHESNVNNPADAGAKPTKAPQESAGTNKPETHNIKKKSESAAKDKSVVENTIDRQPAATTTVDPVTKAESESKPASPLVKMPPKAVAVIADAPAAREREQTKQAEKTVKAENAENVDRSKTVEKAKKAKKTKDTDTTAKPVSSSPVPTSENVVPSKTTAGLYTIVKPSTESAGKNDGEEDKKPKEVVTDTVEHDSD